MNIKKKALLYLILASILWSIGGLFIKLIHWNPIAIAGARSGIASLVMLLYLRKPINIKDKTKLFGALNYSCLFILFVTANKLTTSANAILLQFTAPIWVVLFSKKFLKESIKNYDLLTIFFVFIGMILFFLGNLNTGNMLGNLLAILSGVAMSGVVIFLKLQKEGSPTEMALLGNIITFLIAIPFFLPFLPTLQNVLALLVLGIFQVGISYILYTNAVKYVSPIEAILIPVLEPLLNPIWVFIFTKEAPGFNSLIGGLIVVLSITLREVYIHKKL
ncbi:membrane protein [Clostridium zeae]|uniref:Membrane protein n=1 Tax=Clostridium zeae TaxID=2759022 RepID=A0ABQ1EAD6_9CLOT|nr:DMT family transporter [Clostridium zeae]GFZ31473.1 membrane protein [Clostridium zeae]